MNISKFVYFIPFLCLFLTSCSTEEPTTFNYFYFDTPIQITVYDNVDYEELNSVFDQELQSIENTFSTYISTSEISQINEGTLTTMSEEFSYVLSTSLGICNETNGTYDPSLGTIINLWDVTHNNTIPSSEDINNSLSTTGCNNITIDDSNITLNNNVELDFGSIVKGYASDQLIQIFKQYSIESGLINLGGNVTTVGEKSNGQDYTVGIRDPRIENPVNESVMSIQSSNQTISTSGINQRFFEVNGEIYHHIIDPSTGYPVDNNIASVTIISSSGIYADALSTAIFTMGIDAGLDYINNHDQYEAIIIDLDNNIYLSDNINNYQVFDDDFKVIN